MIRKSYPTQAEIKELLDYDPATGIFTWRERPFSHFEGGLNPSMAYITWNAKRKGTVAGSTKGNYVRIEIGKTPYAAHKLAWIYVHGDEYQGDLDHKNRNKKSNWIDNLRPTTFAENTHNSKLFDTNTSGVKGVGWDKGKQRWKAHIMVDGKSIYLGSSKNFNGVVKARYNAEIKYGVTKLLSSSTAHQYLQEARQ